MNLFQSTLAAGVWTAIESSTYANHAPDAQKQYNYSEAFIAEVEAQHNSIDPASFLNTRRAILDEQTRVVEAVEGLFKTPSEGGG
jgi:hypothetical protein